MLGFWAARRRQVTEIRFCVRTKTSTLPGSDVGSGSGVVHQGVGTWESIRAPCYWIKMTRWKPLSDIWAVQSEGLIKFVFDAQLCEWQRTSFCTGACCWKWIIIMNRCRKAYFMRHCTFVVSCFLLQCIVKFHETVSYIFRQQFLVKISQFRGNNMLGSRKSRLQGKIRNVLYEYKSVDHLPRPHEHFDWLAAPHESGGRRQRARRRSPTAYYRRVLLGRL